GSISARQSAGTSRAGSWRTSYFSSCSRHDRSVDAAGEGADQERVTREQPAVRPAAHRPRHRREAGDRAEDRRHGLAEEEVLRRDEERNRQGDEEPGGEDEESRPEGEGQRRLDAGARHEHADDVDGGRDQPPGSHGQEGPPRTFEYGGIVAGRARGVRWQRLRQDLCSSAAFPRRLVALRYNRPSL